MATDIKSELMSQFKKEFSDSPLEVMSESQLAKIPGWITTGNYALNWAISKDIFKGLPMGRIILFSGDPASGKSMIALSMMREEDIDLIIYMDSEGGGVSEDFAKFLGIDPSKIMYNPVDTIEELIEKMKLVIDTIEKNKTAKNILMIVDSISMLTTERERDPSGGQDMGNKAKVTRAFFRTYSRKLQKLNIAVVMTAHLTQNIGGYGPAKSVAGGTVLGYAPSIEVRFSKVNAESETEKSARGTSMVKIRAEIEKSRFGTTGKRIKFDLDMQRGLDPYAGLFDILKDYEFIIPAASDLEGQIEEKKIPKKSSGWWMFKPWEDEDTGSLKTKELFDKMIAEGLTKSGKFREKEVKDFCRDYEWFMQEVQECLGTIYAERVDIPKADEEVELNTNEEQESSEEEKETKPKRKKAPKVEISEVSA